MDNTEDDDDDRRHGSIGPMKPLNGGESRCDGLTPPPPQPKLTHGMFDLVACEFYYTALLLNI